MRHRALSAEENAGQRRPGSALGEENTMLGKHRVFVGLTVLVGSWVSLSAAALADGRKSGSVLVYPVQRTGVAFFSIITVTNTNLNPAQGTTDLHFEYANAVTNPQNAFEPLNCVVFDRVETLTPADTLTVATNCHNAASPAAPQGYLVVSAQDPALFDTAWSFNHLFGTELVINTTGSMYQINAIPFDAVGPDGSATDADMDHQLDFDGVEYEEVPDLLFTDFMAILGGNQNLALLTLTGGPQAKNTVLFQVWNDNEFLLSTTLEFRCWFDQNLLAISQIFHTDFLSNNTPGDPGESDLDCNGTGEKETGWIRINSIQVTDPGGAILSSDGALLGALTAGPLSVLQSAHLLWESRATQPNGQFIPLP
jgi:hypothetical protein